ncbi:MAG: DUF4395 domain-containing protein [Candidatus Pacebacteria bacterium]|nr:DUF4395 domain-containing protein [Candidatus Paceibacterota bacterium]
MIKKLQTYGFFTYGKVIPGLMIHGKAAPYPVLNERAIRAGAGIAFAIGLFAFFQAFYLQEFIFLQGLVLFLFLDFSMKVIVGTKFSPLSNLANFIVSSQKPEYVGAVQKRFAWSIGLILSGTMMLLIFGFGIMGVVNLVICGVCLTFMFMESAFGICVGCKIYNALMAVGIIKTPEIKPACPGNVCAIE